MVRRVAGDVEPAEPLQRDDLPATQATDDLFHRHRETRPARRARRRLRVEASIVGVVVLALAGGAHRERGHRRLRPVVGEAPRDREARPAMRAVEKGVTVPAVPGVEALGEARQARGRVRADARRHPCGLRARADVEGALAGGSWHAQDAEVVDARERRELGAEGMQEALGRVPLDLEEDACVVVVHPPREAVPIREAEHERAKPDTLDEPGHAHANARGRRRVEADRGHAASTCARAAAIHAYQGASPSPVRVERRSTSARGLILRMFASSAATSKSR